MSANAPDPDEVDLSVLEDQWQELPVQNPDTTAVPRQLPPHSSPSPLDHHPLVTSSPETRPLLPNDHTPSKPTPSPLVEGKALSIKSTHSFRQNVADRYAAESRQLAQKMSLAQHQLKARYAGSMAKAKMELIAAKSEANDEDGVWDGGNEELGDWGLEEDVKEAREALEEKERALAFDRARRVTSRPAFDANLVPDPKSSLYAVLASLLSRYKPEKPKPWTGDFDYVKREAWIKTARGFMAQYDFSIDAQINESLTPSPFNLLRNLFSPDASHGKVSPQDWFDSRNRRIPFRSAREVFDALREHWSDPHAADRAWTKYRSARQGGLRARDLGSELDSLADSCIGQVISDADRRATFLSALNSQVADFVKTQM
ncbi:hypothetical protein JCM16303_003242 [Sporobolomyces ruberrimus]